MTSFDKDLLNQKKQEFVEAVKQAAGVLGFPAPKVNFWEIDCPESTEDCLAHYHPDTNGICVSKKSLLTMNLVDVRETAIHEVTHMLESGHGSDFQKFERNIRVAAWKPQGGIHVNGSNKKVKLKKKKAKHKECGYHLCNDKGVEKCVCCEKLFCVEHVRPVPPHVGSHGSKEDFIYNEKWGNINGHPCLEFEEEESVYAPNWGKYEEAPVYHEEPVFIVKPVERSVEKPVKNVVAKPKPSPKIGACVSKMFEGRPTVEELPVKEKPIEKEEKEEEGFWEWLKNLFLGSG